MSIVGTGLCIRYGDRVVLTDFSLTIGERSVTAIVGPSGSGKSSLLAVLSGLQRPDAGSVEMRRNATEHLMPPNPNWVAWVTQGAQSLMFRSVLDNVAIAALSRGLRIPQAHAVGRFRLAQVGLADRADAMCRELSGGELQRVALARALATDRPFVFADEPSSNLDAANTRVLSELLRNLDADATVVVATHDPVLVHSAAAVYSLRPADGP